MPTSRLLALALGAVAALCSVLMIAWSSYRGPRRREELRSAPEGRRREVAAPRRLVLVLGLNGAGKSRILQKMRTNGSGTSTAPTQGFNSVSVTTEAYQMELLEVGGSLNLRTYWSLYLSKAAILVFVLDSANHQRLLLARQELHRLLEEAQELPLVVVANKQDKVDALSVSEMHQHLALHRVGKERRFSLLGTSATAEERGATHSIQDLKTLLVELLS